jgi:hypothetical protein
MGSLIKMLGIIFGIVQAIGTLILTFSSDAGLLVLIVGGFTTVLTTLLICTIGNISDRCEQLAEYVSYLSEQIHKLNNQLDSEGGQEKTAQPTTAVLPDGRIPAWKRVQMEAQNRENE